MRINGRLLLLLVVTGLFVRVWATNDRARGRSKPPARNHVTYRMPPPDPAPQVGAVSAPVKDVVVRPVVATTKPMSSMEETWTETNSPIPLPTGIGTGIYRVVDDTGRVARLVVAPPAFPTQEAVAAAPDFLMTTSGAARWYFIRLPAAVEPPLVVQSPELPFEDFTPVSVENSASGDERPLCMNRKFDFTGYVVPNWNAAPDVEELASPEPSDLPVSR